jgi:formylglycine-generating enzyme required for sulfatase activity
MAKVFLVNQVVLSDQVEDVKSMKEWLDFSEQYLLPNLGVSREQLGLLEQLAKLAGSLKGGPIAVALAPAGMVLVQGGSFLMGSPAGEPERNQNEGPQRRVTVASFFMDRREVTQAEFEALMGTNPSYFKGAALPVEQVSWYDAVAFANARSVKEGLKPAYAISRDFVNCDWTGNGYRLPTEAEWEYACRAGTAAATAFGNSLSSAQANFHGDFPYNGGAKGPNLGKTAPVGGYAANPWGLYDMHGNVYEWCWDWFGPYPAGAQDNPAGPASGALRVSRGGSWNYGAGNLRSAYRGDYGTTGGLYFRGFRLVRPVR